MCDRNGEICEKSEFSARWSGMASGFHLFREIIIAISSLSWPNRWHCIQHPLYGERETHNGPNCRKISQTVWNEYGSTWAVSIWKAYLISDLSAAIKNAIIRFSWRGFHSHATVKMCATTDVSTLLESPAVPAPCVCVYVCRRPPNPSESNCRSASAFHRDLSNLHDSAANVNPFDLCAIVKREFGIGLAVWHTVKMEQKSDGKSVSVFDRWSSHFHFRRWHRWLLTGVLVSPFQRPLFPSKQFNLTNSR